MLDAIDGIKGAVAGVSYAEYARNWTMRRAVERGVEIVSEASRHIPDELKQRYPHIYWREISAIGNMLRHEYGRIDDLIMWRIVEEYLPELKVVATEMLEPEMRQRSPKPGR